MRRVWSTILIMALLTAAKSIHAITCGPATVNASSVAALGIQSTIETSVCDQISQKFQTNSLTQVLGYMASAYAMASKGAVADYASNIQVFTLGVGTTVGTSGIALPTNAEEARAVANQLTGGTIPSYGAGVGATGTLGVSFRHLPFRRRGFFDPKNFNVYLSGLVLPPITSGLATVQATAVSGYIQYKILPGAKIPLGLLTWGGLDLGLGYTYMTTKATLSSADKLTSISFPVTQSGITYQVSYEPTGSIGLTFASHVIPLEVSTNFSVLYFLSFVVGGAMDYHVLSSASINAGVSGPIKVDGVQGAGDSASFAFDTSGKVSNPVFFRAFFGPQINIWKIRLYALVHISANQNYAVTLGTRFAW